MQDVVQRRRGLAVGDRAGRCQVIRPHRAVEVQQEADGPDLVGERNPAHHLGTGAEPGEQPELGGQQQAAQHAAALAKDEAAARVHDADALLGRWCSRCLPVVHHAGQEPLPGRGVLGDLPAAGIAVPADSGGGDEDLGRDGKPGQHARERAGGEYPAGPDLRLVRPGPAVVAHSSAGQVHASVDAVEGRVTRVGGAGVPADFPGPADVGPVSADRVRRPPDQADDLVAICPQACRQRGTNQPG